MVISLKKSSRVLDRTQCYACLFVSVVEDPPSTKQEVYPFQLFAFRIFDDVTGCLEHKGIRSDLAQEKDRLTLAVASSTRPFIGYEPKV